MEKYDILVSLSSENGTKVAKLPWYSISIERRWLQFRKITQNNFSLIPIRVYANLARVWHWGQFYCILFFRSWEYLCLCDGMQSVRGSCLTHAPLFGDCWPRQPKLDFSGLFKARTKYSYCNVCLLPTNNPLMLFKKKLWMCIVRRKCSCLCNH